MKPRDQQRAKLYAWERMEFEFDSNMLELNDCQAIVDKYLMHVKVTDGRRCRRALACIADSKIKLPRWARKKWVVLHEIAHFHAHGMGAAHGPTFVKAYITLLAKEYKGRSNEALQMSAIEFGLSIA